MDGGVSLGARSRLFDALTLPVLLRFDDGNGKALAATQVQMQVARAVGNRF